MFSCDSYQIISYLVDIEYIDQKAICNKCPVWNPKNVFFLPGGNVRMPAPPLDGVAVEEGVDGSWRSSEIAPFKDVAAFSLLPEK